MTATPMFPPVERLPESQELPDPFLMRDGKRVQGAADWGRRREEIKATLLHYQYGHMPPPPGNVIAEEEGRSDVLGGMAVERRLRLSMGPGRRLTMGLTLTVPHGNAPRPVIMTGNHRLKLKSRMALFEKTQAKAV